MRSEEDGALYGGPTDPSVGLRVGNQNEGPGREEKVFGCHRLHPWFPS